MIKDHYTATGDHMPYSPRIAPSRSWDIVYSIEYWVWWIVISIFILYVDVLYQVRVLEIVVLVLVKL